MAAVRIDLVGTIADFRAFGPPRSLPINHLLGENRRTPGRTGEDGLGAITRAAIAVVGGFASVHIVIALNHIFVAASLGMLSFGCLSLPGLASRQGFGATGRPSKQDPVADNTETTDLANAAEVCPASASLR